MPRKKVAMTVTISLVNNRFACGRYLRSVAVDKKWGLITNVKLTRITIFIWHLSFDVEVKR